MQDLLNISRGKAMKKEYICLIILLLPVLLLSQTAVPPGGNGTEANPYLISSINNLYWVAADTTNRHFHYRQIKDIDASVTWEWFLHEDGYFQGWLPIGEPNGDLIFNGSYDGQGYIIDSLYTRRQYNVGLFGATSGSLIKNLGITNARISGSSAVGALIGYSTGGTQVKNCYSTGFVSGGGNVGGLVGYCTQSGSIENSFSKCKVVSSLQGGGLIGMCFNSVNVINCYALGNVTGDNETGGLIGELRLSSRVENCYCIGFVDADGRNPGALIGENSSSEVINCFWNIDTSNQPESTEGTGLSTHEMKTESTYSEAGWDFDSVWFADYRYNQGYPYLNWQVFPSVPEIEIINTECISGSYADFEILISNLGESNILQYGLCWDIEPQPVVEDQNIQMGSADSTFSCNLSITGLLPSTDYYIRPYAENSSGLSYGNEISFKTLSVSAVEPTGEGSELSPYLISSLENLLWIKENNEHWDKNYLQTSDINAQVIEWNDSTGWLPIGGKFEKFSGKYDGNGYIIDNFYIRRWEDMLGLFGATNNALLKNINIRNAYIEGRTSISSLVGSDENGIIDNCSFSGNVRGYYKYTGGLIGFGEKTTIANCTSDGSVTGDWYTGGISGKCDSSSVSNCVSECNITGGWTGAGGIIGEALYSDIDKCHFTGSTSGDDSVGGITGRVHKSTISESNNTGNIIGGDNTGGISGQISYYSSILNCYNIGQIEGNSFVGGITGESYYSSEVKNCYSTGDITKGSYAGGLIGINNGGCLTSGCYSTGSVIGSSRIGGLIGHNFSSTVKESYSYSDVTGNDYVGGFIGRNESTSIVVNCFSHGNVTGSEYIGGFCGYNSGDSITYSYSKGVVTGMNFTGGFVGYGIPANVTNSFWDIDSSGISESMGGASKKTSEMKTIFTYTDAGWDFIGETTNGTNDYWTINSYNNYGYPYLNELWVGIEEESNLPDKIVLSQNYPNPFNPNTTIRFTLPCTGQVKLTVFNSTGQIVSVLTNKNYQKGTYSVLFNAENMNSGMYFYQLKVDDVVKENRKKLFLK
ncbi:MAG: T9SS type A sorting domain-containing protein [Candidatus Delongbacteria bacterium]|nr:T9SS type A sorting domain-containing protein [Candidatus Delongbacteria bacterium]